MVGWPGGPTVQLRSKEDLKQLVWNMAVALEDCFMFTYLCGCGNVEFRTCQSHNQIHVLYFSVFFVQPLADHSTSSFRILTVRFMF